MVRPWDWNSKRGSVIVFMSFILVSMIGVAVVFVINARDIAEESYQRTMTDLSCRSVLSEFDIRLKEDYGVFAVKATDRYIEEKIKYYLRFAEENSDNMFSLDVNYIDACTEEFSICNTDVFEAQIIDAAKFGLMEIDKYYKNEDISDSGTLEDDNCVSGSSSDIQIENENLPSDGYHDSGLKVSFEGLTTEGLKEIASNAGDTFMVNTYAFQKFGTYCSPGISNNTYFKYEIEYIIAGQKKDDDNIAKVKQYFLKLRTPVNIAKIYADSARASAALAEAELITPGPAAVATQAVIIAAWALDDAEAEWKEVLEGKSADGLYYDDYLAIFLTLEDRELKFLRMMDLIELNLKKTYYKGFEMSSLYSGFAVEITLNGNSHTYEHKY